MRHTGSRGYMDSDYRDGQYEFRQKLIAAYGHFNTIEPTKRIPAAPSKGRPEQPPYRNVLIHYCVMLAGNTACDEDNVGKFLFDTLGPISARTPTKKDIALEWVPLFRNDRQVIGGHHLVVDQWQYNHIWFEVCALESPEEISEVVARWLRRRTQLSTDDAQKAA
jgi:hypothetical protein